VIVGTGSGEVAVGGRTVVSGVGPAADGSAVDVRVGAVVGGAAARVGPGRAVAEGAARTEVGASVGAEVAAAALIVACRVAVGEATRAAAVTCEPGVTATVSVASEPSTTALASGIGGGEPHPASTRTAMKRPSSPLGDQEQLAIDWLPSFALPAPGNACAVGNKAADHPSCAL